MSKYIEFELIDKKPKTNVYAVKKKNPINPLYVPILGYIEWYGAWRQYCFYPKGDTIFNMDCMQYIIDYIKELMEARKE